MKTRARFISVSAINETDARLLITEPNAIRYNGQRMTIDEIRAALAEYETDNLLMQWYVECTAWCGGASAKRYDMWHRTDAAWKALGAPPGYVEGGIHWSGTFGLDDGTVYSSDNTVDGKFGVQTSAKDETSFGHNLAVEIDRLVFIDG